MKKYFLIVVMMVSGMVFSQDNTPVLEAEGQLVKATYYYENGKVQQVGYFKDGKLDGKWIAYNENGTIKSIGEYTNGQKSGKWIFNANVIATDEVAFSNNEIVTVRSKVNGLAKN